MISHTKTDFLFEEITSIYHHLYSKHIIIGGNEVQELLIAVDHVTGFVDIKFAYADQTNEEHEIYLPSPSSHLFDLVEQSGKELIENFCFCQECLEILYPSLEEKLQEVITANYCQPVEITFMYLPIDFYLEESENRIQ